MNAEIIAVGSELLLGQITNTNAKFISQQLSEIGINVYFHTVVGDNPNRLKEAMEVAETRADCIIFSGGLGPTKDDLTKETIAKHLNCPLVHDEDALAYIESFFIKRNRPMTENNKKQALVLEGCKVLKNHNGMAPGMFLQKNERTYILLPGPPKELEPMFQFEAKPLLTDQTNENEMIVSHVLRFYGIGESELEVNVQHILGAQTNPTVAPLASDGEVTLRITAKAKDEQQAFELIKQKEEEILSIVGEFHYGYNDDSLASKVVEMLVKNNLTISAAESLTAGLFQSELAEIPGVSAALIGGVITYTEEAKIKELNLSPTMLQTEGVVSEQCAMAMATAVRERFNTSIGIGLTGAAGPEPHGNQPAGTVWIGIAIEGKETLAFTTHLIGSRNSNRLRAVKLTFSLIMRQLEKNGFKK